MTPRRALETAKMKVRKLYPQAAYFHEPKRYWGPHIIRNGIGGAILGDSVTSPMASWQNVSIRRLQKIN